MDMNQPALDQASQAVADRFIGVVINDIKQNCLKLPSLPEVANKVRKAVEDENSTAAQVAKLISADAALSAKLLRVANSPLYRGAKTIENVQNAIARLGNNTVRNIVTSLVMQQLFQTQSALLRQRMKTLWLHSTEVSVLSQFFARKFSQLEVDQAMLAGLLHDIGTLSLLSRAEDFPEMLRNTRALDDAIDKLHHQVGKMILEAWKFPPEIVAVAYEHEELDRLSSEVDYVDVVSVANLHSYIGKPHRHAKVDWSAVPALAKLGLKPAESLLALEEAKAEIAEMKSLLGG
jgi:putative nucleotidyltransferase with HDIG domain